MSSFDTEYPVYNGFWINWSSGSKTFGSTLTLSRANANLLIAFLALFVAIVNSSLWDIISFCFHLYFSTSKPKEALYHQRQAVFRNNAGPASTIVTLFQLAYKWQKTARTFHQIFPLLVIATIIFIGSTAAAGFSSTVGQGTEVLLSGEKCRVYDTNKIGDNDSYYRDFESPWGAKQVAKAALRAEQCYRNLNLTTGVSDCIGNPFVRQELQVSANPQGTCPFDAMLCASNTSSIVLDTGYIDTHNDLGINAPPGERIQIRRVLECVPLDTGPAYSDSYQDDKNNTFSRYYYGSAPDRNYTYKYPSPKNYLLGGNRFGLNYDFNTFMASSKNGSYTDPSSYSDFDIIPNLRLESAIIYLIFLSANGIFFEQATSDPWYYSSKTRLSTVVQEILANPVRTSITEYLLAEQPASPLACVQREQWCFPGSPPGENCTSLIGEPDLDTELLSLVLDKQTCNRIEWLRTTLYNSFRGVDTVPSMLGGQSLTSRFNFIYEVQAAIAPNQWQQDATFWNAVNLAAVQQAFVSAVLGDIPNIPGIDFPPRNKEEYTLCSSQKVKSTLHVSFSVFGLSFIAWAVV